MNAYLNYKQWWIDECFPSLENVEEYGNNPEQAFREHVNKMSLYWFMETLCDFNG